MARHSAPSRELPRLDSRRALELVMRLMAIPGKSREEGRVLEFIRRQLRDAGLPDAAVQFDTAHRRIPGGGEVGNLIVKLPGTRRGPRRLLMAHVDTVPICVGSDPVRDGDRIRSRNPHSGLGGDDRAGASVVLYAALEILRQKLPHPPLTLFWPVQEEIGLNGARYVSLNKLGHPKLCFNWDGGLARLLCIGATGDYGIEITIEGLASHAGVHPEQGVSAIAVASLAITELVDNGWHGLIVKGRNSGTSNIGVIAGGEATNVVTPRLTLRAEARSHDPRFRQKIVAEFRKAFETAAKTVRNAAGQTGTVTFHADLKYESFRLPEDDPSVAAARAAISAIGLTPETRISNGGLDANWMTAHGLPTVTLGCGQDQIHTVNEVLDVPNYLHACQIGLLLATGCSAP